MSQVHNVTYVPVHSPPPPYPRQGPKSGSRPTARTGVTKNGRDSKTDCFFLVEKGYEELRGLSEVVVEHEVLKGVVQRYAPNVMMTKLDQINVGKLQESMAAIVPVFEKCRRYIASHSQPLETQGIRPTLDELKADYDTILKAREPHKR